jgi:hypothetical protein
MNLKLFLALSLAANLALGIVAFKKSRAPDPAPPEVAPAVKQNAPKPTPTATTVPTAVTAVQTNAPAKRFDWQSVESADYKEYITNLRAIGCPEETIRDIITADVNKMFDDKRRQSRGAAKKYEYWKAGNPMMGMVSPEDLKKSREVEAEREATLKNLGIQPDLRTTMSSMMGPLDSMFDFIAENKRGDVLKAMSSIQDAMASGQPDAQDILKAQKDMEQKVKALLTPEEALQYDLRLSMTANIMRQQLGGFDPNEEEFMKVFQLRKSFDDQFSPLGIANEKEEDQKKRKEAETLLKDQIKQSLGETRYADYERAQDYGFQQMLKAAQRGDAGTAEAAQAWDMKKMAEQKANEVRKAPNMNKDQRDTALRAIRAETEGALKQTLGDKGWENYNRPMNLYWLDGISRNQKVAPPK